MLLRLVSCVLWIAAAAPAFAGAFLQPEGKLLVIQQATSGKLRSDCDCPFANKRAAETTSEWGLTSFLTLLARVSNLRRITSARDDVLYPPMLNEVGARLALWQAGPNIVSTQIALRAADDPFRQGTGLSRRDLQLMFGHSFNTTLGPGFLSLAPGLRSGAGSPVEGRFGLAAGLCCPTAGRGWLSF